MADKITEARARTLIEMPKRIEADIIWREKHGYGGAVKFETSIVADIRETLDLHGWYSTFSGKLVFAIICNRRWRIYGLDMGRVSHNSCDGKRYEGTHKQIWTDKCEDGYAFRPEDITATWDQPQLAWQQFCNEAHIEHTGAFMLPETQAEVLL